MPQGETPREGQLLTGSLFNEPMRIETVRPGGDGTWVLGLVGQQSERFRKVTLRSEDLENLTIIDTEYRYDGDDQVLRLGLQAYALGIAYEFDPYFGLSISRVDPLPHQLEAVYDYLLKVARVRFLLADDAGAGKTIMAGLLIRELQLRGLAERILVVCPANLSFQWQRELKEKFDEKFLVMKGSDIRDQFGVNQWLEQNKVITSLDLAKRTEILPGLRQVHWDLVIIDEAHRMSWTPPARKTARYALGELLRDASDHELLLTATPHKGDPENFSLFLQLLDEDAYADVRSIREAMERRRAPFYLRRTKEAMVYFPERRPNGSWAAEKIFTKRIPHTVDFQFDGPEFELYREVTRFVKRQSAKAAAQGDDPRARAQERRVVPETIARFIREAAEFVPLKLKIVEGFSHTFEPAQTPSVLRQYEHDANWKLPALSNKYPRCSTDRETAETKNLEWVTPGHPLFETIRRHTFSRAADAFGKGACFYSLQHEEPARIDFYRARVVDGLGHIIHERLFAIELTQNGQPRLREPHMLGNFSPAGPPQDLPAIASAPEASDWLHENVLQALLEETHKERLAEVTRIGDHIEFSLTELLQRADEEIGRVTDEKEAGIQGAVGRLARAENRHAELLARRERRVAEDRRDCYWLYVVTNCATESTLQEPIKNPAKFPWREVTKVAHYWLEVNAMTKPMQVREDQPPYGKEEP